MCKDEYLQLIPGATTACADTNLDPWPLVLYPLQVKEFQFPLLPWQVLPQAENHTFVSLFSFSAFVPRSLNSCTGEISHGFKNQWYHSERKNPARIARFRAVAGKETAGGGRTISHLHCSYSFGWLYTTIFTVLSCRRSSPNLGCEHSDTGTGSCTAPAQPSFAPGYQHNLLTGTNYQCRNAGINKVHKLHIKSSWRIINPRASYSYQKARVYTVKAFLKCHMRLQQ